MEQSIICCDVFAKIRGNFGWLKYEDENKKTIYCMPYVFGCDGLTKFRINNCPSCGKEIREIQLKD